MKKKLIFKKGISLIHFPFLLNDFTSWQEQVGIEMRKIQSQFLPRKNICWGFEISENGANINVYKKSRYF